MKSLRPEEFYKQFGWKNLNSSLDNMAEAARSSGGTDWDRFFPCWWSRSKPCGSPEIWRGLPQFGCWAQTRQKSCPERCLIRKFGFADSGKLKGVFFVYCGAVFERFTWPSMVRISKKSSACVIAPFCADIPKWNPGKQPNGGPLRKSRPPTWPQRV